MGAVPLAQNASASVQTATINISMLNPGTCAVSASTLNFPAYTGALSRATTTITTYCSTGLPYTIALNPGLAPGATVTTRQMTDGKATTNYALFSDSAYTVNWGQTPGTDTVAATGTSSVAQTTVYGQIPAGQYPAPGSYSDTVTATVTY
jgi:spore coat protein U-like protein